VAALLLTAACAGTDGSGTVGETLIDSGSTTTTGVQDDDQSIGEDYLVALSNILGEAVNREESCVEEASTDAEANVREMFEDCVIGPFDAATSLLADLAAPQSLAAQHEDYVASRHAWYETVVLLAPQLTTFEDAAVISQDPDYVRTTDALASSCQALESAASQAGFPVSLSCPVPEEPARTEQVTATIDSEGWVIEPAGMIDSGGGVVLTITNADDKPRQPVVVFLFDGDPSRLPLRDGVVDLGQAVVVSDANADPEVAHFGLTWPESDGEDSPETAPDLTPGDSLTVALLPGNYVILDRLPGAYAAGEFATLVVVSVSDLVDTYVAPANAAQSCDELADVIVGLYDAYMDEVALMTAEGFAQSPLSMVNDLRFGTALQRIQQLGCDEEEMQAAVLGEVCESTAPDESAKAVILEQACGDGA
jgi:hypothetical protein